MTQGCHNCCAPDTHVRRSAVDCPHKHVLAFKVVKEILIGVGGGVDRVICKIAFPVMVKKNPVVILSLATLSLFDPRKSDLF